MRMLLLTGGDGADLAVALAARLGPDDTLDVVVPVTRDLWVNGLKSCPDVDEVLDALHAGEDAPTFGSPTFGVADELDRLGFSPDWLRPSDTDLARQVVRTELLHAGYTLTEVTAALATRAGAPFRLLPVSDDRAEQHVVVDSGGERRAVHVAEHLARGGAAPTDLTIVADGWSASPTVLEAADAADVLVTAPSSATLAIGPLLAAPGLRERLTAPSVPTPTPTGTDAPDAVVEAARRLVGAAR